MNIDITKYFDLDKATYWISHHGEILYEVSLISKVTGEIITITFDEEYFNMLLNDMSKELNRTIKKYVINLPYIYKGDLYDTHRR